MGDKETREIVQLMRASSSTSAIPRRREGITGEMVCRRPHMPDAGIIAGRFLSWDGRANGRSIPHPSFSRRRVGEAFENSARVVGYLNKLFAIRYLESLTR